MKKAIVVEDQPVLWHYAETCLQSYYQVVSFCTNTHEAELAIKHHKPDLVWMDCYLGEISELNQGPKNSGIILSAWIKKHYPQTKIFLFTASDEQSLFQGAKNLDIDGIALGGKYIKDINIVKDGIQKIAQGARWLSPNLAEDFQMINVSNFTLFEFAVVSSMLLGKSSAQIADDLDSTRKQINNALYRVKYKLFGDEDVPREFLLETIKEKMIESLKPSKYHNLSEIVSINTLVQETLKPILNQLQSGNFDKYKLDFSLDS
jgi:DNA-binding NarL/FixJ family response regulator